MSTFAIKTVDIEITYPDDTTEMFSLKRPYTFEFRFKKIAKLPDYKDAFKRWQPGCYFYQFMATYEYEHHDMDLRKLLVAKKIVLKFPPVFDDTADYQSAEVLLANDEVPKNYLQGLALAENGSESVPSGSVTLEFEGTEPINESELRLNYLFGTGGTGSAKTDHFITNEQFSDIVMVWTQEVGEQFTPTQLYKTRDENGWSSAIPGPDTDPRVDIEYQIYHTHTDANGVMHLVYIDDNSDLWYTSYDGSWSALVNFDTADYGFNYMNIQVHGGEVYVFYAPNDTECFIWKKSTNTIITVTPSSGGGGLFPASVQGDRPFIIASDGTWYVAINTYDGLMIKKSTDSGSSWDEFYFADFSPYNNPLWIYGNNLSFAEDSNGIVHLTFILYESNDEVYNIYKLKSNTWETVTAAEVIHTFDTTAWNSQIKSYHIDNDDIQHLVLRGPDSGGSPRLLGFGNDFETNFDEANPLDSWTIQDLLEPEGDDGIWDDPVDGIYRNQGQDSVGHYLNYYAVTGSGRDKTGYMSYNSTGSYTNVRAEMTAELSGPNINHMFLFMNGNGATNWEDFEGYLFTFQKFDVSESGYIHVYKKQAGDTTRPTYFSDILMGSVSHSIEGTIGTLKVDLQEFEENPSIGQEQENRIHVKVYNESGINVGNRVFVDSTNPIQQEDNEYGVYHETFLTKSGASIDKNIYYFRVTDLDSAQYSQPEAITPGLWHIKGLYGNYAVDQILETETFEAREPYAILDGKFIHIAYERNDKLYFGTYQNESWSFTDVEDVLENSETIVVIGTYQEAE